MRLSPLVVGGVLGVHAAVTLLSQLPNDAFSRLKSRDLFAIVPTWRFFAPIPARSDYHLFCRGLTDDGMSDWVDVHPVGQRRAIQFLWHPEHRAEKGVFDVMAELLKAFPYTDGEAIHRLGAFRIMEEYVLRNAESSPELDGFERYQFCIVGSAGYDESIPPTVLFVSREVSRAIQAAAEAGQPTVSASAEQIA